MSVRKYLKEAEGRYESVAASNVETMKDVIYGILEELLSYVRQAESQEEILSRIESIMEEIE